MLDCIDIVLDGRHDLFYALERRWTILDLHSREVTLERVLRNAIDRHSLLLRNIT